MAKYIITEEQHKLLMEVGQIRQLMKNIGTMITKGVVNTGKDPSGQLADKMEKIQPK
jgi:hypothetical protein